MSLCRLVILKDADVNVVPSDEKPLFGVQSIAET